MSRLPDAVATVLFWLSSTSPSAKATRRITPQQVPRRSGPVREGDCALALVSFVAFGAVERRVRHPLVNPELLRHPLFLATMVGAMVTGLGMIGMASFLPIVAQEGFGSSLRVASLPPLMWAVASMLSALAVRRLPFTMDGTRSIAVLLG